MSKQHPFITLTLALALTTSSIYGQDSYYQEDEEYSSAYVESSNTAHWSVYIPIAVLVGAAIWFGLADRHHEKHDSSKDSQDALGSIANSKRVSHSSSYQPQHSHRSINRSGKSSHGSYSH